MPWPRVSGQRKRRRARGHFERRIALCRCTRNLVITRSLKSVVGDPVLLLASGFGSGFLPRAPGTWGTLLAALLYLPLALLDVRILYVLVALAVLVGIPICSRAAARGGETDPGWIVWDEMAATWLLLALVADSWVTGVVAVGLFRVFDIMKPWPISVLERRLEGGVSIMIDDLAAVVPAALLVLGLGWWLG